MKLISLILLILLVGCSKLVENSTVCKMCSTPALALQFIDPDTDTHVKPDSISVYNHRGAETYTYNYLDTNNEYLFRGDTIYYLSSGYGKKDIAVYFSNDSKIEINDIAVGKSDKYDCDTGVTQNLTIAVSAPSGAKKITSIGGSYEILEQSSGGGCR